MSVTLRRAGGFVVGIVLFLFGFSLLQPMEGVVQTGVTIALASVLTALGCQRNGNGECAAHDQYSHHGHHA
jgi:hypothetical protein